MSRLSQPEARRLLTQRLPTPPEDTLWSINHKDVKDETFMQVSLVNSQKTVLMHTSFHTGPRMTHRVVRKTVRKAEALRAEYDLKIKGELVNGYYG